MRQRKPRADYSDVWALLIFCAFIAVPAIYLVMLFIQVVYLGGSSACPQNLC
jgi:hypothetical protein